MKILFICSQNRLRSLTAETIFDGAGGHQVRSAGTESGARVRVTAGHVGWADLIFVMEKRHVSRLQRKFREEIGRKRVICLFIPDDYEYMDEELIERLRYGVAPHIEFADCGYRPLRRSSERRVAACVRCRRTTLEGARPRSSGVHLAMTSIAAYCKSVMHKPERNAPDTPIAP